MRYNEDQLSHVNDDHVVNVVVMGVFASPRSVNLHLNPLLISAASYTSEVVKSFNEHACSGNLPTNKAGYMAAQSRTVAVMQKPLAIQQGRIHG